MRKLLTLLVAVGVVTLLVVHAGVTGCASSQPRPDPWLTTTIVSASAVPTLPVPSASASASEATAPVAPDPVVNVGFLPASKAGPVFYPRQAAP